MKTLVIDVGGTHIKLLATGKRTPIKLPSGPDLTPEMMADSVLAGASKWEFDNISIGYPGPVTDNRPTKEPVNLGGGWVDFDFEGALGKPVRIINDAAMQALGSYEGGRMLFLGLGTGLGTTLIVDGTVIPLELAHLPYRKSRSYEEYVGDAGLDRLGKKKWRHHVEAIIQLFLAATNAEYAVLGGGNVRHFEELPPICRRGSNLNAFKGGFRLWKKGGPGR